jgi:hypothetical protein
MSIEHQQARTPTNTSARAFATTSATLGIGGRRRFIARVDEFESVQLQLAH